MEYVLIICIWSGCYEPQKFSTKEACEKVAEYRSTTRPLGIFPAPMAICEARKK